jgi:hypothetical protein
MEALRRGETVGAGTRSGRRSICGQGQIGAMSTSGAGGGQWRLAGVERRCRLLLGCLVLRGWVEVAAAKLMNHTTCSNLKCDGAHVVDNSCPSCLWGSCIECKNHFKGGFGWNNMRPGCDPSQQPPPVIPAPTVIIPASTTSSKKALGRAKRATKATGLGGFGGNPSSSSDLGEDDPEEDDHRIRTTSGSPFLPKPGRPSQGR